MTFSPNWEEKTWHSVPNASEQRKKLLEVMAMAAGESRTIEGWHKPKECPQVKECPAGEWCAGRRWPDAKFSKVLKNSSTWQLFVEFFMLGNT